MTLHVHLLNGCRPIPLAFYLKAIGVHRLVASQADRDARADWSGDRLRLITRLDRSALLDFFLRRYVPTPIVAPWNGGSGFYPKDNTEGIDAILNGGAARLAPYRAAIERGRSVVGSRSERPEGDEKRELVLRLRREAAGEELAWICAAIAPVKGELEYPALLGTGGNDGRLDFTNNQMQRLAEVLDTSSGEPRPAASPLLEQALFDVAVPGLLGDRAIGQFFPGSAGGANATAGFEGNSLVNPWDFILMFEGAILFRVAVARRMESETAQAAAPFAVRGQAAGYASAAPADESARGEQWMPLWDQPASLVEVESMFAEGRLQSGAKPARRAVEAALAVARLGASRGIATFERYGYIERNGQANLAVPLGRWRVPEAPASSIRLVEPLLPWVDQLRAGISQPGTPPAFARLVRRLESDILEVCERPAHQPAWQALTVDLGRLEAELVRRPKRTAELRLAPIPRLPFEWFAACDDGSREMRLAAAIAAQRDFSSDRGAGLGPIRRHVAPLVRPDADFPRFVAHGTKDPAVVWAGRGLVADLIALVLRRLVEAQMEGSSSFPLGGRMCATLTDVAAFLSGDVDEPRVAGLARGLMAVRWSKHSPLDPKASGHARELPIVYAAFRMLYAPALPRGDLLEHLVGRPDPRPLRLLLAGRVEPAFHAACRRLGVRGLRPKVRHATCDRQMARRVVASLAIPISPSSFRKLRDHLSKPVLASTQEPSIAE